jgi:glycerol uptake facilitator protein
MIHIGEGGNISRFPGWTTAHVSLPRIGVEHALRDDLDLRETGLGSVRTDAIVSGLWYRISDAPFWRRTMSSRLVQRLSAEALGTLILVYFGVAATLAATGGSLGVAAAYAVALALAVWIFGAVSGAHVNPAVTIALAVRGRFAWRDVPGYLIAQVAGGILAGLLAWATYGAAGARGGLGTTVLNPGATTVTGLLVEAIVAFLWVLAYYALVVEESVNRGVAGLGVGLAYGIAILALAPITGASANFARTFGAELSAKLGGGPAHWGDLWIYAVGPLVGGIVAVFVYDVLVAGRPLMAPSGRRVRPGTTGTATATPA